MTLCFGEELHNLCSAKGKLIIVQVRAVQSKHSNGSSIEQHRRPTVSRQKYSDYCEQCVLKLKAAPLGLLFLWQIGVVKCQHLLDAVNMRRSQPYSNNPNLEVSDNVSSDQMAHIYQDLCSYSGPQRPACYRENMPITV